jgi:hypothetical protein
VCWSIRRYLKLSVSAPLPKNSASVDSLIDPLIDSLDPLIDSLDPLIGSLDQFVDSLDPFIDSLDPFIDSLDPLINSPNLLIDSQVSETVRVRSAAEERGGENGGGCQSRDEFRHKIRDDDGNGGGGKRPQPHKRRSGQPHCCYLASEVV